MRTEKQSAIISRCLAPLTHASPALKCHISGSQRYILKPASPYGISQLPSAAAAFPSLMSPMIILCLYWPFMYAACLQDRVRIPNQAEVLDSGVSSSDSATSCIVSCTNASDLNLYLQCVRSNRHTEIGGTVSDTPNRRESQGSAYFGVPIT